MTGKVGAGQAKPWQHWLARYRRILEAVIIGVAVLVLILWQYPTAAVAIWTAVLAGLAILLIELLCRPAVVAGHATGAGRSPNRCRRAAGGPESNTSSPLTKRKRRRSTVMLRCPGVVDTASPGC